MTLFGMVALSACDPQKPKVGTVGYVAGFGGVVVSDEPRAALVARDILSAGGTAADAAVALAFTLTVTLPSSAGIGGGGVCLVYNQPERQVEAFEFLATRPAAVPPGTERPSAVPGLPRGLFLLHSRHGNLRWEQILIEAETLARFGNPVSRALAKDLALMAAPLLADPEARKVFASPSGGVLKEGDFLTQVDLASTLSRIRRGPGDFYAGQQSKLISASTIRAGGFVTPDDLRTYRPQVVPTIEVPFGNQIAYFPPPPSGGGLAAQMVAMLLQDDLYGDASPEQRDHILAEVADRAFHDRGNWMISGGGSSVMGTDLVAEQRITGLVAGINPDRHTPPGGSLPTIRETPAATGFAVADREGSAVACSLTMNNLFGTGRIAPETGMLLAAAPEATGRGPYALAPVLVVNNHVHELWFAGAASGGASAPTALADVMARTMIGGQSMAEAVAAARVHAGSTPDTVMIEQRASEAQKAALRQRGHAVMDVSGLATVTAMHCSEGLPSHKGTCQKAADPRGSGLSIIVGEDY